MASPRSPAAGPDSSEVAPGSVCAVLQVDISAHLVLVDANRDVTPTHTHTHNQPTYHTHTHTHTHTSFHPKLFGLHRIQLSLQLEGLGLS